MAKGQKRSKNVQPNPNPPSVGPAVSPTISYSDSSGAEDVSRISDMNGEDAYGPSASGTGSPQRGHVGDLDIQVDTEDSVTCQWEDCGQVFVHLPTLISHIHEEHIGVHKSNYTCEWASCLRRGLPQTSRFALISHIRSHTGEKPFVCNLPECDKSFTRSDALAKHMRLQHDISPPAPGRGGSRKRKRGGEDQNTQGTSTPVASVVVSPRSIPNASGFNMFKVEPHTPSEAIDASGNEMTQEYFKSRNKNGTNGRQRRQPRPSQLHSQQTPSVDGGDEEEYSSSSSDTLPTHLQGHFDEATGLVLGRTPAKVMYLCMKAKQQFVLDENTKLLEELRDAKNDLKKERDEKEGALDLLLQRMLGPDAEILMPLAEPTMSAGAATATAAPSMNTAPTATTAPAEITASNSKNLYDSTHSYPVDVNIEKPKQGRKKAANKALKANKTKPTVATPAEISASSSRDVNDLTYGNPDDIGDNPEPSPESPKHEFSNGPSYDYPSDGSDEERGNIRRTIEQPRYKPKKIPTLIPRKPARELHEDFRQLRDEPFSMEVDNTQVGLSKDVDDPTYVDDVDVDGSDEERGDIQRTIEQPRYKPKKTPTLIYWKPALDPERARELHEDFRRLRDEPFSMEVDNTQVGLSKDVDDSTYVDDVDVEKLKSGRRRTASKAKSTNRKPKVAATAEMSASSSKDVDDSTVANPDVVVDDPKPSVSKRRTTKQRFILKGVPKKPPPPMSKEEREKAQREGQDARAKFISTMPGLTEENRARALLEMGYDPVTVERLDPETAARLKPPMLPTPGMTNPQSEVSASGSKDGDNSTQVSPDDGKPKPGPRRTTVQKIIWKPNR